MSPEMQSLVTSLEGFNANAEQLQETARTLPAEIGTQLNETLARSEASQASLQKTMAEARATLDELNGTLAHVEPILTSIERTTGQVAEAGVAWAGVARAAQEMVASFDDGPDPAESSEPFRILDYTDTAQSVTLAAAEINAVMASIQSANRDLEGSARSLIDHLLFRVGELILLVVASLIVVRAVWARIQPRSRESRA